MPHPRSRASTQVIVLEIIVLGVTALEVTVHRLTLGAGLGLSLARGLPLGCLLRSHRRGLVRGYMTPGAAIIQSMNST
jgi:hypothetical protein